MIRMLSIFALLLGCLLVEASLFAQDPFGQNMTPQQQAALQQLRAQAGNKPTPGTSSPPAKDKGKTGKGAAKEDEAKGKDGKTAAPDQKEGPAENIKRTGEPPEEPDADELEVAPDNDGLLEFQFRNQPWPSVLRWYAEVCDLSFDWQELPGDYINLATQRPHTLEETGDMINRALLMRGFTILQDGETLTVAKVADINPSLVPRVEPQALNELPPHKFVRTSFPLTFLLAEEVHQEFASMISKNGKLTPLQSTNRLEGMDAAANLRDIHEILEMEQSAIAMQDLAKEFPLTYARAASVKEQLEQFLGIQSSSGGMSGGMSSSSAARMMQQQMQQMQQQMQRQMQQAQRGGAQAGGSSRKPRSDRVYLVANERSNSIIVHAPPNKMAIIASFITRVDVKNENAADYQRLSTRMKVFRLASLSPSELVASLTAMDVLEPATRLQVDDDNNAIIAYASVADQFMIQQVIDRLDGSERNFEVIQLRRLKAEEVAGSIKLLMGTEEEDDSSNNRNRYYYDPWSYRSGSQNKNKSNDKMRIGANVQDNQLLLWVNEIELEEINKLLEKLGEIPSKGDRRRTTRIIDASRQPETYEYLLRLKEQWDRVSPNPLLIPDEIEFQPPEEESGKPEPEENTDESTDSEPAEAPSEVDNSSTENITGAIHSNASRDRFARLTSTPNQTLPQSGPSPNEKASGKTSQQIAQEGSNLEKAQQRPPVRIFLDPSGNLVIQSDDTDALDRLERVMQNNKPPQKPYDVFKVKYARASWVTLNLEEYFEKNKDDQSGFPFFFFGGYGGEQNNDKDSQLGDRAELKFIWDNDTNTIVVQNANDLDRQTIKQLIELWDVPEEEDTSRIRYTKLIPVRYSRAENIVNTIKEAYRDLLSANDKTFQGGDEGGDEESKRGGGGGGVQGDGFNFSGLKGKLSLGPDTLTNSILISVEGEDLLKIIEDIIMQLDKAAMDQGKVEVLTLSGGMSGSSLKKALSAILGGGGKPKAPQQNPGQQAAQQQAQAAAQQAQAEAAMRSNGGGRSRGRGRGR